MHVINTKWRDHKRVMSIKVLTDPFSLATSCILHLVDSVKHYIVCVFFFISCIIPAISVMADTVTLASLLPAVLDAVTVNKYLLSSCSPSICNSVAPPVSVIFLLSSRGHPMVVSLSMDI